MFDFLFGKKTRRKPVYPKPRGVYTKTLLKNAKKYKVRLYINRKGAKYVFRNVKSILADIRKQMKKGKSRSRFGSSAGVFSNDSDFGYSQDVRQTPGITNYTNVVVPNLVSNSTRPTRQLAGPDKFVSTQLPKDAVPVFGVGKTFFNQTVPQAMSPRWYANAQPPSAGGGLLQVGSPFSGYKNAVSFGKKRKMPKKKLNVPDKFVATLTGKKGMAVMFMDRNGRKITKKITKIKGKKNTYRFTIKKRIFKITGSLKKGKKVKVSVWKRIR